MSYESFRKAYNIIKGISFELAVYKKGVLESESSLGTISWSELEQISLRNGMIAVIPDFQNFKVKLIVAGEGTKFSTEFNILEDVQGRNYYGRSAKSIDEGKLNSRSSGIPFSATVASASPTPSIRPSVNPCTSWAFERNAISIVPNKYQKNASAPAMPISVA